ncbi:MAG: hypothetical protein J6386_24295 [Candidatus Synoicihabitans palmerolidicus]|nr:hypothetical protein [Candidatus Synoicihabitans palmerolidicus]
MITRPLDLASKLRTPPWPMDGLFYTNVVLLGLFFGLFGSRFILSPGIAIERSDFKLVHSSGARSTAIATTAVISVLGSDMVFTDVGRMNFAELAIWLPTQVARGNEGEARLLVRADSKVSAQDLMRLNDLAKRAGFSGVQLALESRDAQGTGDSR